MIEAYFSLDRTPEGAFDVGYSIENEAFLVNLYLDKILDTSLAEEFAIDSREFTNFVGDNFSWLCVDATVFTVYDTSAKENVILQISF